jgi:hypothetical protein
VHVTRLAPSRLARQPRDERPVGARHQLLELEFHLAHVPERGEARSVRAQLARRLRAAQQQLAHDRGTLRGELQGPELRVAEQVLVLRHPAAESRLFEHQLAAHQAVHQRLHLALVELEHRVAVALLVAGVGQRVERQRVLVRRGDLLLDEAADHACFVGSQFDGHAALRGLGFGPGHGA